jgi:SAM-dependent methyltransferase
MKPTACPICGEPLIATGVAAYDRLVTGEGLFTVLECPFCRLGMTDPQLGQDDLARFYADSYYEDFYEHSGGRAVGGLLYRLRAVYRRRSGARRNRRPPFDLPGVPPGCVLDVGCGAGELLADFGRRGWTTYGVDPSGAAVAAAARRGATVHEGTLGDRPWPDLSFDLITMAHSLEHIVDPVEAVRQAVERLAVGGLLAIEVPNWACWQRDVFRGRWFPLDLPRHQQHFSPRALDRLGAEVGMRVRKAGTSSTAISTAYSIHFAIAGHWEPGPLLWLSYALSLPLLPFVYLIDRIRGGDCCHVVLEKAG